MSKQLLMGNEAFAHAALEAGVNVVAGYPGTPSSEVVETVAKLHAAGKAKGVHVEWSTNEKAALEMLAGAAYCGARVLFTCKQVGLNVASDALMSLNYIGVRGGCVLFVADDPGPISSQTEQDTRRFGSFSKVPVLDPATPEQGFAMMKAAFDLSERYQTPVIVRPTTRICHASTFFEVADETQARALPQGGFERSPRWVIFPRRAWEAHGEINDRLMRIACDFGEDEQFAAFNQQENFGSTANTAAGVDAVRAGAGAEVASATAGVGAETSAPTLGIVAGGVSAMYAREALRALAEHATAMGQATAAGQATAYTATTAQAAAAGQAAAPAATTEQPAATTQPTATAQPAAAVQALPAHKFLQLGTPYPFPADLVAMWSEGLSDILVLEELDHVLEDELLKLAGQRHLSYTVHGKLTGEARDRGENTVEDIAQRIAAFLGMAPAYEQNDSQVNQTKQAAIPSCGVDLPVRPPVLCAGCPHRGSFYAVKKALGKTPAVYCGDIGCYTLGNAKPLDAVDTCLCMGAGITMSQGFAVADPGKKALAFVGDSTFFASGMTGMANAVYNGHDITLFVLDNSTTAMTGGQPHPGTGARLMGPHSKPLSIEAILQALGVECILHANPQHFEEAKAAAKQAISFEGPSVVIFKAPCVQLIKPDGPAKIDTQSCTGCKKCITEIGCPGIGFDIAAAGPKSGKRGQAVIDTTLCNGCGLCTQICPFKAIEAPGAKEPAGGKGAN